MWKLNAKVIYLSKKQKKCYKNKIHEGYIFNFYRIRDGLNPVY